MHCRIMLSVYRDIYYVSVALYTLKEANKEPNWCNWTGERCIMTTTDRTGVKKRN